MNVSKARELLAQAAAEPTRLDRHLLVAAALREVLRNEPIVVGGTAQELYTAGGYNETDLDLVGSVTDHERKMLVDLGFSRSGRHWFHEASKVAVEFPESHLDGDMERVYRRRVRSGTAAVIGVDDLYLDRVRQATAYPTDDSMEFRSAIAVGVGSYDIIDWRYVGSRIHRTIGEDPYLGRRMSKIDAKVRRLVRKEIKSNSPGS